MSVHIHRGFTAVELLITIIVGMIFIGAVSQVYTVVINDAAATRYKATARSLAYTQARVTVASLGATCTASNATITLSSTGLPAPVSQTTNVACPYVGVSYSTLQVARVTVTVSYGGAGESAKHVLYKY